MNKSRAFVFRVVPLIVGVVFILLELSLQAAGGNTIIYAPLVTNQRLLDIAFVHTRESNNAAIARMKEDGSGYTVLYDEYSSYEPDYSPDGTKIAFISSACSFCGLDLFVMNADGTGVTQLTDSVLFQEDTPDWSPDGTQIIYIAWYPTDDTWEIYAINQDGTNVRQLTDTPDRTEAAPQWLPNGTQIGFSAEVVGIVNSEIYIMDADGTNEINLTNSELSEVQPVWSPDGAKIAFARYGSTCPPCAQDIFLMNQDGSDVVQLTDGPDEAHRPAWSPDGRRIAFSVYPVPPVSFSFEQIYLINADGSGETALTEREQMVLDWAPTWSPK